MLGKLIPEALKHLFKKEATNTYPKEPFPTPENFRGKLKYFPKKCTGCKLCVRDCPAQALDLQRIAEKQFKMVIFHDRCVNCGQCVDICPTDALEMSCEHEYASYDRASLREEQST